MKTAKELRINRWELENLIKVRDLLASDKIRHDNAMVTRRDGFNMGYAVITKDSRPDSCGTIMCIGGWMKAFDLEVPVNARGTLKLAGYDREEIRRYVESRRTHRVLGKLFYPEVPGRRSEEIDYSAIKRKQAVQAIDNVLEHGNARWEELLTPSQFRDGLL